MRSLCRPWANYAKINGRQSSLRPVITSNNISILNIGRLFCMLHCVMAFRVISANCIDATLICLKNPQRCKPCVTINQAIRLRTAAQTEWSIGMFQAVWTIERSSCDNSTRRFRFRRKWLQRLRHNFRLSQVTRLISRLLPPERVSVLSTVSASYVLFSTMYRVTVNELSCRSIHCYWLNLKLHLFIVASESRRGSFTSHHCIPQCRRSVN